MNLRKLATLIFSLSSLRLLLACGTHSEAYSLKSPSSQVYIYNSTGVNVVAAWASQIGTVNTDGSLSLFGTSSSKCLVCGPYASFLPGPSGVGHINAQVDLQISGGTVVVDLVSSTGTVIHDSKTIVGASDGSTSHQQTINLNGVVFSSPLENVEVRVHSPKTQTTRVCEDSSADRAPTCKLVPILLIRIFETRIIYN